MSHFIEVNNIVDIVSFGLWLRSMFNLNSSFRIPLITLVFLSLIQYSILRHLIRPETEFVSLYPVPNSMFKDTKFKQCACFQYKEKFFSIPIHLTKEKNLLVIG